MLYIQLVTKPYTYGFYCSRLHIRLHSVILSTFVMKLLRQCWPALANKSHLNTTWSPCEVRWLFSRTFWAMTLLRDFFSQTHTHPCCFILWVYILVLWTLSLPVIGSLILDTDRLIGNLACYVNSSTVSLLVQLAALHLHIQNYRNACIDDNYGSNHIKQFRSMACEPWFQYI